MQMLYGNWKGGRYIFMDYCQVLVLGVYQMCNLVLWTLHTKGIKHKHLRKGPPLLYFLYVNSLRFLLQTWYFVVRDSSVVRRHYIFLLEPSDVRALYIRKQRICFSNSGSAHFHISCLSDFIFYQKPLYKSLHQSFFYSFITILPSESGVTLHYSTILP
jgi:hypothetical protein